MQNVAEKQDTPLSSESVAPVGFAAEMWGSLSSYHNTYPGAPPARAVPLSGNATFGAFLLFEFEELQVATLPPMGESDSLRFGRLPDCDVVLTDSSVSKQHAELRWHEPED